MFSHRGCLKYMVINCGRPSREKTSSFGVSLEKSKERVPLIIRKCIEQIESTGFTQEAVWMDFRASSKVKRVIKSFENAGNLVDLRDTPAKDLVAVIKTWMDLVSLSLLYNTRIANEGGSRKIGH